MHHLKAIPERSLPGYPAQQATLKETDNDQSKKMGVLEELEESGIHHRYLDAPDLEHNGLEKPTEAGCQCLLKYLPKGGSPQDHSPAAPERAEDVENGPWAGHP